jgi:hypothetical protein
MDAPAQTLPRVEPGHETPLLKLPRQEGVGVEDKPGDPNYPKHITHPYGGTLIATDADHEETINASIAALPPKPAAPVFHFADECSLLLKRDLTVMEIAFCNSVETAAKQVPPVPGLDTPPEPDEEPSEEIKVPVLVSHDTGEQPAVGSPVDPPPTLEPPVISVQE